MDHDSCILFKKYNLEYKELKTYLNSKERTGTAIYDTVWPVYCIIWQVTAYNFQIEPYVEY